MEMTITLNILRVFRIALWQMFRLPDRAKNLERDARFGHGWTRGTQYRSWRLSTAVEMHIEIRIVNIRVSNWTSRIYIIIEINRNEKFLFLCLKYY